MTSKAGALQTFVLPFPVAPLVCTCTGSAIRSLGVAPPELEVTPMHLLSEIARELCDELAEYACGQRTTFDLPLDVHGTAFQMRVWDALQAIGYGTTRTYAQLASMVDSPKACRAVGMANNRNPIMILIPCHRVIGAGGILRGFGGGIEVQRALLSIEGVELA